MAARSGRGNTRRVSAADAIRSLSSHVRPQPRAAWDRVRGSATRIAQAAGAGALAWYLARMTPNHSQPYFAPIAAVIAVSAGAGRRGRHAVELILGVAAGVAVADLIVFATGTGAWQLALVVALAMSVTTAVGGNSAMVGQAAVSAILIATVARTHAGLNAGRLIDALVGGGVALVFSQVLFPVDPVALARDAARRPPETLTRALGCIRQALASGGRDAAVAAVEATVSIETREPGEALGLAADATEVGALATTTEEALGQIGRQERLAAAVGELECATGALAAGVESRSVRERARAHARRAARLVTPVAANEGTPLEGNLACLCQGLADEIEDGAFTEPRGKEVRSTSYLPRSLR